MLHNYERKNKRARSPTDTLAWLNTKLKQTNITRIANITGLDNIGIPVVTTIRPNSKFLSVSQGKGLTLELAKISAIMESIECYHVENPRPAEISGSYNSLKINYPVINPNLFEKGAFCYSDLENYPFDWTIAEELMTKKIVYIPHILTCLDSTIPRKEYGFFSVTTNGLASGNTLEEALCHALYEVIERDNLSRLQIATSDELNDWQINIESIDDEINKTLITKLQTQLNIIVWDITGKFSVPTFHAAIWDPADPTNGRIFTGSGTHFQKEIALSRAITEAAQAKLTIISGLRDDIFPDYYHESATMQPANHFLLGKRFFSDCVQPEYYDSYFDNLKLLQQILLKNHYSAIYWVNHTKPEIDVPVIQLFIPGLKHDHSRM